MLRAAIAIAGFTTLAAPAAAPAAITTPPKAPHSIIVFPVRDFVSASGYVPNDRATVEILRNGLVIGRAAGVVPQDDPTAPGFDGLVEVNHPGGACWGDGAGSPFATPDILPGDVVRITTAPDIGDQTTTANVTTGPALDMGGGTVIVHGTAQDAAGNPLPVSQVEQRVVAPNQRFAVNNRRTIRASNAAGAEGTLAYDAPGSINWTATYSGLSAGDVSLAVNNEARGMWLGVDPAATVEGTIFEYGQIGGPAAPCTAPVAANGVTTSSPNVVNAAFATTSPSLTLSGVAQAGATQVDVSLDDQDPLTAPVAATVTLPGGSAGQTWSASIAALAVGGLSDGALTASASFTIPGGTIPGTALKIVKDTVAPAAPTAAPGPGQFNADQSVKLSAEAGALITCTTDGSPVRTTSPQCTAPIAVTGRQTIDALAIDQAGNAGPATGPLAYVVDKLAPTTLDNVAATFRNADVTVTLTAGDGTGTGVKETWYTTDGSDPSVTFNPSRALYVAGAKPTLGDGAAIRYFSVDNVGNAEAVKTSPAAKVDKAAPATSDDVPAGFRGTDITVTLTAGDGAGSGVAHTWYTTDGSDPTDPANAARTAYNATIKPVLTNGQRIRYASVDNVGNAEAIRVSAAAQVDKTAPTTNDDVAATFSASDVTVTLAADDGAGSGVAKTWYTTNGSDPTNAANAARNLYSPGAKPTLADGERIRYYSEDRVGNAEAVRASPAAKVDKSAPSTSDNVPAAGYSATDVTVTLTAGDGTGSGVAATWYTTDGSNPTDAANTARKAYSATAKPVLADGQSIRYASVDNVGNAETPHTAGPVKVDKTAPTTTDNVPATFQTADVTVTLSATDAASGVARTWYTTDGSDPTDTANTARKAYDATAKPLLTDGHSIRYASVDNVGNAEAPRTSAAAKVDKTAPTTTDTVPAGFQTTDVVVTLTATDTGGSGLAGTWYTTNGSDPTAAGNAARQLYSSATKPVLTDGQTIRYASYDAAGNMESAKSSTAAKVDNTAPTTTDNVPAGFQSADVTVTLSATDSGSGVARTWYTTDGSDPTDAANTARTSYNAATKPVLAHGQRVRYASVDNVGNTEAVRISAVAQVDKTPPTTADDVPATFSASDVTVTLTADDGAGSGVARTWYTTNGSDPTNATNANRHLYSAGAKPTLADGERIRYSSEDRVGNTEAVKASPAAKVDKTAPSTTDNMPAAHSATDVTVTLTASDGAGSGVAGTWYTTDGSDPTDPVNTARKSYDATAKPVLADGQSIRYASVDKLGNTETPHTSAAAKVDRAAPTTTDNVPAGFQSTDVTVTLTAGDGAGSGVARTWYTADGSDPTNAANTARATYNAAAKPVLADGQRVRYASVDNVGNTEPVQVSAAAKVDKTAPTTTDDVPLTFSASDVTVTLAAEDGAGSGVARTWYTTNGSDPTNATNANRHLYSAGAKPTLTDGERIRYSSEDRVGNTEAVKASPAAKVDKTAPSTTDNVPAGFQSADVTVTLTAGDGTGSGVAATWYTTDGSDPTDPANTARKSYDATAKPVLTDGRSIRYASVDKLGNTETPHASAPAKVDKTAPTTTDDVPATFQTTDVTVTLAATDAGSGVARTWYTTDGSDPTDAANAARKAYNAAAKPVLADGQRIRYASLDNVGNTEPVQVSAAAKVDNAAPATTDNVPAGFQATDVVVTLTATDTGGSGLLGTWYTTNGSDPTDPGNAARRRYSAAAKPTLANGERIRYASYDGAGNMETAKGSAAAKVDNTAPATGDDVPAAFRATDVTVTLTAGDGAGSGVAKTWYTTDGSDPTDPANTARAAYNAGTKPVLTHGQRIRYASVDTAGNTEAVRVSAVAQVDKTAPTSGDDVPAGFRSTDITVTLAADDGAGSGVATTWYTTNGSDPTNAANANRHLYSAAAKPTLADGERIRYVSVDNVGNTEAVRVSAVAQVDKAAPSTTDDVPAGFQAKPVVVTLSSSDGLGSGVAKTWYTTDSSDPSLPANGARKLYEPLAKPTLTDGQTIRYASVDNVGNTEPARTSPTAKVDTVAPVTVDNVQATFSPAGVTVTLTATDAGGSGVVATWFTTDGSDPSDAGNPGRTAYSAVAKPTLGTGDRIRYYSVDALGNAETVKVSAPANVDSTAPVTGDDVPAAYRASDVVVTLAADDGPGSGVKSTWYTTDGSDPTIASNASRRLYDAAARPTLGDGERIRYSSVDNVGNVEAARGSVAAKVDKTAPTTADDVPVGPQTGPVTVTLTATDIGSGTRDTWYTTDGSNPADAGNPGRRLYDPSRKPVLLDGAGIRFLSIDRVGNAEAVKASPTLRIAAPAPPPGSTPITGQPGFAVGATRVATPITMRGLRKRGLSVTTEVLTGIGVVTYEIQRGARTVGKAYRFRAKPGTLRVALKQPSLLRQLRPGAYRLVVRMGSSAAALGAPKVIRFQIRR